MRVKQVPSMKKTPDDLTHTVFRNQEEPMLMIKMDALFTIVGRALPILALTLLSSCINTNVNVTCPPDAGGDPGTACSVGNNVQQLPQHTLVSSIANVVPIPANGTIPNGAECLFNTDPTKNSTSCKQGIPGQPCGFTGGHCRDTYTILTTKCACQCNP